MLSFSARVVNNRGDTDSSYFDCYWDAMSKVIEMDGTASHERRHTQSNDIEATTQISYAPTINSIPQLMKKTHQFLLKRSKKEGEDFHIPSITWVSLQLSPMHENRLTAEKFTGRLKVKRQLQSKNARHYHRHGHYVAQLKKLWRYHGWLLRKLCESAGDEDSVDVLPWYCAVKFLGQDDKASIPIGRHVPIAATAHSTVRAIVPANTEVLAADHDWSCEKIVPSVTGEFNIGESVGDSLFSGGVDGRGFHTVALHDGTFQHSTGYDHCASILNYLYDAIRRDVPEMRSEMNNEILHSYMPYEILIEADGGCDHNFFLQNKLALFGLFLKSGVDKLIAIRGCPGLSYLNTEERAMSVLNIGLANLSLKLEPCQWLTTEVLHGASSMKAVRKAIGDYDRELPTALNILRRRSKQKQNCDSNIINRDTNNNDNENHNAINKDIDSDTDSDSDSDSDSESESDININNNNNNNNNNYNSNNDNNINNHSNSIYEDGPKVGMRVKTYYSKSGWYKGTITNIINNKNIIICVEFEDGEKDEWSIDDFHDCVREASINVGDVGYKFVKVWKDGDYSQAFDGTVTNITAMGNRQCVFCDGLKYTYTLDNIKKSSETQYKDYYDDSTNSDDSGDDDDNDNVGDNVGDIVRGNGGNGNRCDNNNNDSNFDSDSDNDSLKSISNDTDDSDDSDEDSIQEAISNGIYLNKQLKIPLEELEERPTAKEAFSKALAPSMDKIMDRFKSLDIDGRNIEVRKWPDQQDVDVLTDVLQMYDPDFSRDIRSKAQLHRMPLIKDFLSSNEHFRETDYCLEFKLCGNNNCIICKRIGRTVRTPTTNDGKLRNEVTRYLDLPVLDSNRNKDHFLSPEMTRKYINKKKPSFESLMENLDEKEKDRDKDSLKKNKEKDKENKAVFVTSKLRDWIECESCSARRCIYSMSVVGGKNGPSTADKNMLDRWKETHGYVCGNKPGNDKFIMKMQHRCGDTVETQYYDSVYVTGKQTTKGRKITTDPVCYWCYDDFDVVVKGTKVRKKQDLKGKNLLPICRTCYNNAVENNIKLPTSGGCSNKRVSGMEKRLSKKRLHQQGVDSGKRTKRR